MNRRKNKLINERMKELMDEWYNQLMHCSNNSIDWITVTIEKNEREARYERYKQNKINNHTCLVSSG